MKTQHNIFRITAAALAAATLLSGCMKDELKQKEQAAPNGEGEFELIVEVGEAPATKTTITRDGTILPVVWKEGDKLYVAGATDGYIGCMELEATQASGEGVGYHKAKFKGKMSGWTSTQVLHFYYLGSSEPTLTDNKFTFDISSQEGTLAWIQDSGHISHAATESALAPGSHTLSLTMNNMNAVILYDLSEWTSGVTISGTFNKAVLDLKAGTFDTTDCTGDIALAADKCTASTYVTFIPDNKALTFKKGAASTPTKANNVEAGKFYSNASAAIVIPMLNTDILPGLFSVSPTTQIQFSKGNLQATYHSSTTSYTWGFAAEQYDYVGDSAGNTTIDSQTDGSIVDLFGWSTVATNYGVSTSSTPATYSGVFKEWSTALVLDYTNYWSTLSDAEWSFLVGNTSPRSTSLRMYGVTVCGKTNCLVLAPDDYTGTIASSYNATEWAAAETAGLVCLPSSGYRDASTIGNVGDCGYYWSSTANGDTKAYRLGFDSGKVDTQSQNRNRGRAVRLVKKIVPGALHGEFSVSPTIKVQFSKGNLWTNSSVSPQTWSFENNQYDSTPAINGDYDVKHVSHFYWSDLNNYGSGKDYSATSATSVDWGLIYCASNGITPDNTWRTLSGGSGGEWEWLIGPASSPNPGTNCRTSSKVGDTENARYAEVQINGITGLLIFPDEFTWPAAVTTIPAKINTNNPDWTKIESNYSLTDFAKLESAGCVFLPAAGYRDGKGVVNVLGNGYYWSTTPRGSGYAYNLYVATTGVNPAVDNGRGRAFSVRLVKECN